MPKGQTSRPYNRKEKTAVKEQKRIKSTRAPAAQKFKAGASASKTLTNRKKKESDRVLNNKLGKLGASSKRKKSLSKKK